MKKLIKFFGLLLLAGALCMGCSNGSSSSGDKNEKDDSGKGTSQATNAIELSDGNWTFTIRVASTQQNGATGNFTYKFTVQGEEYTLTSGSMDTETDLALWGLDSATDEEIEAFVANFNKTGASLGVTYSYDKTTKKLYSSTQIPKEQLSSTVIVASLSPGVEVTSNASKTMYTYTLSTNGSTATYTFTKDK